MTAVMQPTRFDAPLLNPAPGGLDAVTYWQTETGPLRWLMTGMEIIPFNYDLAGFGVWTADWCAAEGDLTEDDVMAPGDRPEPLLPFLGITTWAADECDMRAVSRAEVEIRAAQAHRLKEPVFVESAFGDRMLDDAGTPDDATDLVDAVGKIDEMFGDTGTLGFVHAAPRWIGRAAQANLLVRAGSTLRTPSGHTWVFGNGYKTPLGDTLVGTSQPFGWRQDPIPRSGIPKTRDGFKAIVQRSLLIGYEHAIGAVTVG